MLIRTSSVHQQRIFEIFNWAVNSQPFIILCEEFKPIDNNLNLPVFTDFPGYTVAQDDAPEGYKAWLSIWNEGTGIYSLTVYYPNNSEEDEIIDVLVTPHTMHSMHDYIITWKHSKPGLFNEKIAPVIKKIIAEQYLPEYLEEMVFKNP